MMGQPFHRRVLEVAHAEAEDGEEHAALAFLFDEPNQVALVRAAAVEVAVGAEDDAVDATGYEVAASDLVRELNALPAVGGAARIEPGKRAADDFFLVASRG